MQTYKVENLGSATALARYIKDRWQIEVNVQYCGVFHELQNVDKIMPDFSMWREVCDAFMAGRGSVVN